MNEFIARIQPLKVVLGILIALGFVAIGVWITGILDKHVTPSVVNDMILYRTYQGSSRHPDWYLKPMAWVSIILFGGMAIYGAILLTKPADYLRINRMGVTVPSYTDRLITWAEIADVTIWSHNGQKSLTIKLRDPSRFNRPAWKRAIDSLNRGIAGGDIFLAMIITDRTIPQALDAIETFRPVPESTGAGMRSAS